MSISSNNAYVRTEMLSEQTPPASNVGVIGWMRNNLFSTPVNAILTIIAAVAIYFVLAGVLPWIFGGVWNATSLTECRLVIKETLGLAEGETAHRACWGVVHERFWNLMYGFYPSELYWRPNLALVLLFVSIAPVLFNKLPKKMLFISIAFIFVGPWLLWGGPIWTPIVAFLGFVIGYIVHKIVGNMAGSLAGLIAGVLSALIWWLFLAGTVSQGITHMIASSRMPNEIERLQASIEAHGEELTRLGAIRDPIVEKKAEIQAKIDAALANGDPVTALIAEKTPVHLALLSATDVYDRVDKERKDMQRRLLLVRGLEGNQAKLDELVKLSQTQKAALPATVSGFGSMKEITPELEKTIPGADIALLDGYLDTVDKRSNMESVINRLYDDVGLVGLKPVQSRDFGGFMLAILLGITGIVLSFPLGIVLALGRLSNLVIVKAMCVGFIEFIRGVPLITLLFVASALLNYFLPKGTEFDIMLRVMIMITIFAAAYMAEVIRGGLAALPTGQYEAADALGLDYWQAQRLIIMPQALKISIPGIVSTFIGLFKDTTLVSIIAMSDPIGWVKFIQSKSEWNGVIWELYGFVALVFFLFCFGMSRYSMYLERKLQTGH